jgi:hypothetical protein
MLQPWTRIDTASRYEHIQTTAQKPVHRLVTPDRPDNTNSNNPLLGYKFWTQFH